jgi:hypothetical protein
MARKPNYNFERQERERVKAAKLAEKAKAKQAAREQQATERDGPAKPDED